MTIEQTGLTEDRARDLAGMLQRIDRGIYVKRVDKDIRPKAQGWYILVSTDTYATIDKTTTALYTEHAVLDFLVQRDRSLYPQLVDDTDIQPTLETVIFYGRSRTGKTTTLYNLLLQFIYTDVDVTICDIHSTKEDSLTRRLQDTSVEQVNSLQDMGLDQVKYAVTYQQIRSALEAFQQELEQRRTGIITNYRTTILVIDDMQVLESELSSQLQQVVQTCYREGRGYAMYCLVATDQPSQATNRIMQPLHLDIQPAKSMFLTELARDMILATLLSIGKAIIDGGVVDVTDENRPVVEYVLTQFHDHKTVSNILSDLGVSPAGRTRQQLTVALRNIEGLQK